jgi:prepilin-type N-terminal cleavage/methylation domain-containing protein
MPTKKGFTLIELLVALGILAVIVTSLYSVFNVSLRAWKKADNVLKATTIARVVLDRITREISSAIIKPGNSFYCLGIDSSETSKKKPNSIADEIYFIAPLNPDKDNKSDLCEVGFWLDGQGTAGSSDDVLERFYVTDGRKTGSPLGFDFDFSTGSSYEFSENITDLQFTFYDSAGVPSDRWDSRTNGVPSKIQILITVEIGMGTQATNPEFYKNSYTTTVSLPQ